MKNYIRWGLRGPRVIWQKFMFCHFFCILAFSSCGVERRKKGICARPCPLSDCFASFLILPQGKNLSMTTICEPVRLGQLLHLDPAPKLSNLPTVEPNLPTKARKRHFRHFCDKKCVIEAFELGNGNTCK